MTSSGGLVAPAAVAAAPAPAATEAGRTGTTSTFATDLATATERLQPVPHHGRTKIVGGERDGRYLNTSGNERDGQVFTMEFHGGRRWHVYGEGADRVVIPFAEPGPKAGDGGADAPTPGGAVAATPAARAARRTSA